MAAHDSSRRHRSSTKFVTLRAGLPRADAAAWGGARFRIGTAVPADYIVEAFAVAGLDGAAAAPRCRASSVATADRGHACCEQTAAKMLGACAMWALAEDVMGKVTAGLRGLFGG